MKVHIEFLGPSRLATGRKDLELDLTQGATFRDIVRELGRRYPALLENVIQSDGETLHPPNMLNVNARRMIHVDKLDEHPNDGDRIIIMSISAGG
ncbi:MAG: MoaD/ThiS family protein [Chloroflexi bacterium]|nr:MoaD/ThiS family protein [Chloroflexota bacterium]